MTMLRIVGDRLVKRDVWPIPSDTAFFTLFQSMSVIQQAVKGPMWAILIEQVNTDFVTEYQLATQNRTSDTITASLQHIQKSHCHATVTTNTEQLSVVVPIVIDSCKTEIINKRKRPAEIDPVDGVTILPYSGRGRPKNGSIRNPDPRTRLSTSKLKYCLSPDELRIVAEQLYGSNHDWGKDITDVVVLSVSHPFITGSASNEEMAAVCELLMGIRRGVVEGMQQFRRFLVVMHAQKSGSMQQLVEQHWDMVSVQHSGSYDPQSKRKKVGIFLDSSPNNVLVQLIPPESRLELAVGVILRLLKLSHIYDQGIFSDVQLRLAGEYVSMLYGTTECIAKNVPFAGGGRIHATHSIREAVGVNLLLFAWNHTLIRSVGDAHYQFTYPPRDVLRHGLLAHRFIRDDVHPNSITTLSLICD
jgi:hypothetical protein